MIDLAKMQTVGQRCSEPARQGASNAHWRINGKLRSCRIRGGGSRAVVSPEPVTRTPQQQAPAAAAPAVLDANQRIREGGTEARLVQQQVRGTGLYCMTSEVVGGREGAW